MQRRDSQILFSASDLVNFLDCEHITTLDRLDLDAPMPKTAADAQAELIQAKGEKHEAEYLARLAAEGKEIVDIFRVTGGVAARADATRAAMRRGAEIIYQACLEDGEFIGYADFLRRIPIPSDLGSHSYEVVDTKLARHERAAFVVQLVLYSALLAKEQGLVPHFMHVVLGDRREKSYRVADYSCYVQALRERFLAYVAIGAAAVYPEPCARCGVCKWRERCEDRWVTDDHLSQVADIRKSQIGKLEAAGVATLAALAKLPEGTTVPKLDPGTLARLRQQAALQLKKRETGENYYELLPPDADARRGFAHMPAPDPGDMFFDMEGNPLEEGGLEYLFGLYYFENGQPQFKAFWAHTRAEERTAFEQFMDFVTARLRQHPQAHIYHYAAYEVTALKKLMSLHGTREAEVDALLRASKLVDLYRVVREAVRVSEPSYSIKNIEHFYLEKRTGEVKDAGASIVYYERWKESGDAKLLKDIEDYNHDDVRSTYELRGWLVRLRPEGLAWSNAGDATQAEQPKVGELTEAEKRLIPYRERLVDSLPADRSTWNGEHELQELTYQLLDFHRRAAKPAWWAMFARQDMTEDELIDDIECLGGLTLDPEHSPVPDKRSVIYTYRHPEQESKLMSGDSAVRVDTGEPVNGLEIDEANGRVRVRFAAKRGELPPRLSLGPTGPISTDILKEAIFRYADALIAGGDKYQVLTAILRRELPRIRGRAAGSRIIDEGRDSLPQIIDAAGNLEESCLFVQGPPGTGKTYTGSHIIVDLLRRGKRVGVSSNSHKAINNLLSAVEKVAKKEGVSFRGAKKSDSQDPEKSFHGDLIENVDAKADVIMGDYQLVAGTAWLFADPGLDQSLDYLFVDEAGQVAIANLVAMGTSARNIVLLGDQMQLAQPIQGVHPGRSGESSLDFFLNGEATIPADRGAFLNITYRLHPDICRFISEVVYDGRLMPAPDNHRRQLVLGKDAHPALKVSGIGYSPIEHAGCTQQSQEEADRILEIYQNLLRQRFADKQGNTHPTTNQDILVVAPYNMQVNLLKKVLPEDARVGTVDKFQGQEAEVVILSMTTSSGDDLPRDIEFLYSKNRLNVALSRARCLAVVVASPALVAIRCAGPDEMTQVNTFCQIAATED
jgi:predicted RecB family nuclease